MKTRLLLTFAFLIFGISFSFSQESGTIEMQCPSSVYISECGIDLPPLITSYSDFINSGGSIYSDCGIVEESFLVEIQDSFYMDDPDMVVYLQVFSISDSCGNIANCSFDMMKPMVYRVPEDIFRGDRCGNSESVMELTGLPLSYTPSYIPIDLFITIGGDTGIVCDPFFYEQTIIEYYDQDLSSEQTCPKKYLRSFHMFNFDNTYDRTFTQNIELNDSYKPVVTDASASVVYNENDVLLFETFDEFVNAGGSATDNCGINAERFNYVGTHTEGVCLKVRTRTYAVFDWCGNITLAHHVTTILDTVPPLFYNSNDYTVECSSEVKPAASSLEELALDHVGVLGPVLDSTFRLVEETKEGTCPQIITRIYEVSDLCGNIGTHRQTIMVNDDEPPVFLTPPQAIPDIEFGSSFPVFETLEYTDNCGIPELTTSVLPYTEDEKGYEVSYQWVLTDSCGNTVETSTSFNVLPKPVTYCESYANPVNGWIKSVTIGNQTNASDQDGYKDFSDSFEFQVEAGSVNSIILTPGFAGKATFVYWRVWIDLNNDGEFNEDELMLSADRKRSAVSGSITIPSGLTTETRMRISMNESGNLTACGSVGNGEVEDYKLIISNAEPQPPVALFTSDKTEINEGESILFSDQSKNSPINRYWIFEGGEPASSTEPNPLITYNAAGTYDVYLKVNNDSGADSLLQSKFITVNVAPLTNVYCSSGSLSADLEWISSVAFGAINNNSGSSNYSDFTAIESTLAIGSTETIYLTPTFKNKSQREYWKVWIDFNNDQDFDDAREEVLSADNLKTGFSGNITIPDDAVIGLTRMRVAMKANSSPSACETFDRGEVEDYSISIVSNKSGLIGENSPKNKNEWMIYPNPAHSLLILQRQIQAPCEVSIYQSNGVMIMKKEYIANPIQMDVSNLSNGIYVIEIKTAKEKIRRKVIKR
ncbi:GEVED domain-containing protein [Maribellus sp. YY47]|uniref:GEVED domain-containing protein n=1 Tax=Maribellus sp. YY47 TaxID=2929486 RepID=UPI002000A8C8|nr:GEVED domain-containing protein [Maribellus sp. YY47]MCK3685264.1 GEVED domain-containing protein [Maribellus sp. YY47]